MQSKRHHDEIGRFQAGHPIAAQDRRHIWRRALSVLSGPVLRLHHYRDVRTRLLHDALQVHEHRQAGIRFCAQRGDVFTPESCEAGS